MSNTLLTAVLVQTIIFHGPPAHKQMQFCWNNYPIALEDCQRYAKGAYIFQNRDPNAKAPDNITVVYTCVPSCDIVAYDINTPTVKKTIAPKPKAKKRRRKGRKRR